MARRERERGPAGQRVAGIVRTFTFLEATQPQAGSLARSSHLWPAAAGTRERFHPLQKMDTNRSAGWGSQGPGSWGRTAGRLSVSPSSTRRKELKEILLQSNSPGSSMRFATAQKTSNSSSLLAGPHQEQKPEQSPEVLSLALDPLEHEWLLTVAQGDADNIVRLMDLDPSLLTRKDFVTGFTALHWLAKHGRHESFIQVMSHAQKNGYPVNVNIPTASGGLTPLHLAALQGHELLIKVLVGAYGADTSRRDHNGRKAWQYLRADTSRELKELAGALEEDLVQLGSHNTNNNWRAGTDKQTVPPSCNRFPAPCEIPRSLPHAPPLGCCLFMTDKAVSQ
ncbi:PREDICTED: ankyrin repeat domain-containing protein SOWAHD isoform X1 [Haliaeetus leucocephalus]|uniref:ankyrin repeat domain-containing protein SOWAHD isoform X1 n=1 Tax=Haliaeetus leucocephalus TaxID=52644 RepID=UPI00053CAB3C|nr:PREDICTED: ankyrin repeat domain-containing protein SOWAHD isoform X1 [Haliaeetus leucocephalus]